jgi:hypothetical protein
MKHWLSTVVFRPEEGAPAAGTGGDTGGTAPGSSAGTENTDTPQGGSPPETVPYSRFKEVNDQLRTMKPAAEAVQQITDETGRSPADLYRLARWEQDYEQNPVEAWVAVAEGIENLPEEIRSAVVAHRQKTTTQPPAPSGTPPASPGDSNSDPPEWAKPLVKDFEDRQNRELVERRQSFLDDLCSKWDEQDKADNLIDDQGKGAVPKNIKLSFIAGNLAQQDPDKILAAARGEAKEFRDLTLEPVVVRPGGPKPPTPVPVGAAPSAPPVKIRSFKDAKLAAREAQARGELSTG